MYDKQNFIDFMIESKVLIFGDFITKSGRKTPYFVNTGNYFWGFQMHRLGEFYAAAIEDNFGSRVTNLFGPAYKGIPICTATGAALHSLFGREVTISFDRKEMKDHGEGGWLMGHIYGGEKKDDNVVIVEDVTTAGTSVRNCLPLINQYPNTKVIGLVVSVDRMERGRGEKSAIQELHEEFGIQTVSLINARDILGFVEKTVESGEFDKEILTRMVQYREKYGVD
jgi:orotate phosphoribosyltransferase